MQVSRNRLSRTDPRGHSSRVFFRYVKRARTARHRSFNETEVSSPASPRSRYFPHHSYPHHLRLSDVNLIPLSAAALLQPAAFPVSALSLQSSSPSRSPHSTVCQLASTPWTPPGQFDIRGYHRYNFQPPSLPLFLYC